jgi:tetratricopeptide (TPR) repeat protein
MRRLMTAAVMSCLLATTVAAGPVDLAKDEGPVHANCDKLLGTLDQWRGCIGAANVSMPSDELFYAGYWLARSGQYREALSYLTLADKSDARVQTYLGFAVRKLGDVETSFRYYAKALKIDPNYSVARAYMGEAFLAQNDLDGAKAQLGEIESRCGSSCPEFVDLQGHITAFEAKRRRG